MKLREIKTIPQEMIEEARWVCSLPVNRITRYTGRIYRAVADIQAHRKMKIRPVMPMKALGQILIDAAGSGSVLDEIIRAEKTLVLVPVDRSKATIREIVFHPSAYIRNKSKRENTLVFIETVDAFQQRHGRRPKRQEIIAALQVVLPAFDDAECTRQIKRVDWGEWI